MKKTMYINANVITVNEKEEVKEAVLVSNGKIEAVGTTEEVLNRKTLRNPLPICRREFGRG